MSKQIHIKDHFIDLSINNYIVKFKCGEGSNGSVYNAKREGDVPSERAIKFIEERVLKHDWQNEINKISKLGQTEGVVPYLGDHGEIDVDGKKYKWIAFTYIKCKSMKELIERKAVSIPILCDVIYRVLGVLYACKVAGINHGDLHLGNILIEEPDPLNVDSDQQRIWITDFCYLRSSTGSDILDDYQGLSIIIRSCLNAIDFHFLDGRDKFIYTELKNKFIRDIQETNVMEGSYVREPRKLRERFLSYKEPASPKRAGVKRIGDYLAAEILGDRYDEWKALFVPSFTGSEHLLGCNICVLTGLRGCGKTMVFRRMTALYDFHLGTSVPEAEGFVGFYFNARSLGEAFPWLPEGEQTNARDQVIHYFHLCWILEILEWLDCISKKTENSISWLVTFLKQFFPEDLLVTKSKDMTVQHLKSFFTNQVEQTRLKSRYEIRDWELVRLDFLELLVREIEQHISITRGKHFYFFLDDYSTPLVISTTQRILNSIVFRRSSKVIFKIATESIESIELIGLNDKFLEQDADFVLVDSATESIQRSKMQNREIIMKILQPRIDRDPLLKKHNLDVEKILGITPFKNTDLAMQLRAEKGKQKVLYHGTQVFCNLWTSDTREIITLFADLVAVKRDDIKKANWNVNVPVVSIKDQNRLLRNAGSRYRDLLVSATDPTKRLHQVPQQDRSYGEHLQKIADSFCEIADFELQTKTSKNVNNEPRKQARRIEIKDVSKDLPEDLLPFYRGMIRYGLFIRDWRGKSVAGKAVPRLFLRGILIPYYTLTFSKRDSITMTWKMFCEFLRDPKEFSGKWTKKTMTQRKIKKRKRKKSDSDQKKFPGYE